MQIHLKNFTDKIYYVSVYEGKYFKSHVKSVHLTSRNLIKI